MVKYDLSHLSQPENQNVSGPIQDDEALFLYSIIRGCRLERILEIGGLSGYSAKNFLQALSFSKDGILNIKRSISQNFISKVTRKGKN